VGFDLARYGQRQSRISAASCDSMSMATTCPSLLFSRGVAFDLKRRRRHAALTSHGISSAARRARVNAGARGDGPGGSAGGLAPGRQESAHLFGQIHIPGAVRRAAVPAQDALTWWCG